MIARIEKIQKRADKDRMSDEDDFQYFSNKREGKTYVSSRQTQKGFVDDDGEVLMPERKYRIASKVFENAGTDQFAKVKDEVVVRRTDTGKQEIKATFYEDTRQVKTLTFQRWTTKSGNPHNSSFSFSPAEISKIVDFLSALKLLDLSNEAKINLTDEQLQDLLQDKDQLVALIHADPDKFIELARNEVTSRDIIALAYRKKQLKTFENLFDESVMQNAMSQLGVRGEEKVWQKFFEKNSWIFGYGLNFVFNSSLDQRKIETPVVGHDVTGPGKTVDGLLKTYGEIQSLCFVEIKTANTELLAKNEYRAGCWAASVELAGAVSQAQNSVQLALENVGKRLEPSRPDGSPTGERLFNYKPKSYVIVGSLDQFVGETGIIESKFRSFELFRRSINSPEIITFDELFHRAKALVESDEKRAP